MPDFRLRLPEPKMAFEMSISPCNVSSRMAVICLSVRSALERQASVHLPLFRRANVSALWRVSFKVPTHPMHEYINSSDIGVRSGIPLKGMYFCNLSRLFLNAFSSSAFPGQYL